MLYLRIDRSDESPSSCTDTPNIAFSLAISFTLQADLISKAIRSYRGIFRRRPKRSARRPRRSTSF
jgi:hypothetical protein